MMKTEMQCHPKRREEGTIETNGSTIPSEGQWTRSTLSTLITDWEIATLVVQEEALLPVDADDLYGFIINKHV